MAKRTHDNGVDRDMTPEEESVSNALIAKWKTEDDAKDAIEAQKVGLVKYGLEYEKQNLSNEKTLGFNIGNILKDKKNDNMPSRSKLDQTRSDVVGSAFYKLNDKTYEEKNKIESIKDLMTKKQYYIKKKSMCRGLCFV